ncbi:four helix bundle protein [Desulfosarcina ovata]|uniref:four helix bundle protein n=1 Tax=Desulfosarcina ovata TaxID=83564 RepID=UPI0018D8E4B1|nr:four helix bundle protein [Desulfosarcina ovata]
MDTVEFNLEERTAIFGERIIELAQSLPDNSVNDVLIRQIVRSGTSVGANYMEADSAGSKKDFKYKIDLCRKEAKETKHWLRMIAKANPNEKETIRPLWQEAHELTLIFSSIAMSCRKK